MGKRHERGDLEHARDRMMAEIHRCDVLGAAEKDIEEWLDDTIAFLQEEFPGLTLEEAAKLRKMGENFVAPVIPHGKGNSALNRED